MPLFYPSYQALEIADQILDAIGKQIPGYKGRIGVYWYWQLHGGIIVTLRMDFTITEQRWDVLRAEAVTPVVGLFSAADFPFAVYGTLKDSPPFIHDLEGSAEWSNRLYFQMGDLISDITLWLQTLIASMLDPHILPPTSYPNLTPVERNLIITAIEVHNGHFIISKLHQQFKDSITKSQLSRLAQRWEDTGLLTERPRRVTIALRSLARIDS